MMDELRKHAGLPPRKDSKGNRASMKDDGERIPRKPKASTAAVSEGGRPKKNCALCAKYSPAVKHTHNTKECRKWNQDGTPKRKDTNNYRGKGNFSNSVGRDDDLKQCFVQMKKEQKALKKLILKQGKKSRKRLKKRRVLSDSSDDDSSSDSE